MASILKFFRILFFYALYFLICMVTVLQGWPVGGQMLFAFALPIILVWWQERRRARKALSKPNTHLDEKQRASSLSSGKRISDGRNVRNELKAPTNLDRQARPHSEPSKSPKQDLAEIVRAGQSAAPALSAIAKRYENARPTAHKPQTDSRKSGWIPAAETTTVAGRDIGGMVYVGTPPLLNHHGYRDKCRAYIDPSLSVARTGGDRAGEGMSYWPGYSDISARSRATYLEWLASGRSDPSYDPGYMFLYFYGLERRFFVDQSNADAKDIIAEVRRLVSLYPENHSVKRYLGEFLDIATLAETEFEALEPIFERQGWELPFSLEYAIGARLDKGENLSADWVLSWLMCHPESHLRTPATRCRDEFLALFKIRFDDRFPNGLKVSKPRKHLKATYRAASSEFEGTLNPTADGKPVPDISGLRKPVEIAQEVADEVIRS